MNFNFNPDEAVTIGELRELTAYLDHDITLYVNHGGVPEDQEKAVRNVVVSYSMAGGMYVRLDVT